MLKNDLLNTLQQWNKGLAGTGGSGELEVQY